MENEKIENAPSIAAAFEHRNESGAILDAAAEQPQPPQQLKRPPAWKFARITINEFRRRYFLDGSRPKQRDVIRWIEEGTAEGVILAGYRIDGRYYIQVTAADAFLTACKSASLKTAPKPRPQAGANWRQKAVNSELRKLGFDFL